MRHGQEMSDRKQLRREAHVRRSDLHKRRATAGGVIGLAITRLLHEVEAMTHPMPRAVIRWDTLTVHTSDDDVRDSIRVTAVVDVDEAPPPVAITGGSHGR